MVTSDHSGALRPCPHCGTEVLHAVYVIDVLTDDTDNVRLLDPHVTTGDICYVARGDYRPKKDGPWYLLVAVTLASRGYVEHVCKGA